MNIGIISISHVIYQPAESQNDFAKRIRETFIKITNDENYSAIGIVTHGMPFWVIFNDILNDNGIVNISDCAYAILNKEGQRLIIENLDGIEHKKN